MSYTTIASIKLKIKRDDEIINRHRAAIDLMQREISMLQIENKNRSYQIRAIDRANRGIE